MLKRLLTGALSAALVLSLTLVPASAHGGGHRRNTGTQTTCAYHQSGQCTYDQSGQCTYSQGGQGRGCHRQ